MPFEIYFGLIYFLLYNCWWPYVLVRWCSQVCKCRMMTYSLFLHCLGRKITFHVWIFYLRFLWLVFHLWIKVWRIDLFVIFSIDVKLSEWVLGYLWNFYLRFRFKMFFLGVVNETHCHSLLQLPQSVDTMIIVSILLTSSKNLTKPKISIDTGGLVIWLDETWIVLWNNSLIQINQSLHGWHMVVVFWIKKSLGEVSQSQNHASSLFLRNLFALLICLHQIDFFRMFHLFTCFSFLLLLDFDGSLTWCVGQK